MYHSISNDPEPGRSSYYKVCTTSVRFANHMQWLSDQGWKGVSLTEAWRSLNTTGSNQARLVGITFDDGYQDFRTQAFPILQRHGFSATLYVCPGLMKGSDDSFNGRRLLSWREISELAEAGIEFGSHTMSHPELRSVTWEVIAGELTASKSELEDRLQTVASAFAYPYAYPQENETFCNRFKTLLHQTGYSSCVTTMIGRATAGSDSLQLPRLPANDADDEKLFVAKLNGSYDWLGSIQSISKRMRSKLRYQHRRQIGDSTGSRADCDSEEELAT